MDLRNRLFPYPIIGGEYDDYKKTNIYDDDVSFKHMGNKIILSVNVETDNEEIKKMINDDFLVYALHIECTQTSFRRIVKSKTGKLECEIEDSKICGKLEISIFIVANKNIYNYRNYDINEDYENTYFTFEKGNIIGIGNQYKINIDKSQDELGKISSIFSIIMKKGAEREFKINLSEEKIKILLSEEDYINYKKVSHVRAFEGMLHSMIALPALIYVFDELKREGISGYEDYRWYRGLQKSLKKYDMELSEELLTQYESIKLAQLILDMPINRGLNGITLDKFQED